MKKVIPIVIAVVITALIIVFVPKLAHTCDDCEKFFVGTGYQPNILADVLTEDQQIICKDCAEKQHQFSTAIGKSLDDYKIPLFD